MPAAIQASATSMTGMPTMPNITGTSRARRAEAIRCAPVCCCDILRRCKVKVENLERGGERMYVAKRLSPPRHLRHSPPPGRGLELGGWVGARVLSRLTYIRKYAQAGIDTYQHVTLRGNLLVLFFFFFLFNHTRIELM